MYGLFATQTKCSSKLTKTILGMKFEMQVKEKQPWLIKWLFSFTLLLMCSFVMACGEEQKFPVKGMKTASAVDFTDPTTGIQFIHVKGGCFKMGDIFVDSQRRNKANLVHEVCLDDFYIGKYEVTVGQFRKFVQNIN
jgi:formylglycine-generating enzyme required for sulfatase activity